MGGVKLSVHPLFFALGFYYAATGRIAEFVICTLTAVIHELGHSYVAAGAGYRLDRMVLMPFGAVVRGDISGLNAADEIKIAIAGPLVNVAVGVLFVAVWWVFPEAYSLTDTAAQANFTMAIINFIPAYPLDGGRVLFALISGKSGKNVAAKVCKVTGAGLSLLLAALFVVSLFHTPNFTLAFFAAFVFAGAFSRAKDNVYIKAYASPTRRALMRGIPVKRVALHKSVTVKKMMSVMEDGALNEIAVCDEGGVLRVLFETEAKKMIESCDLYEEIGEGMKKISRGAS